MIAVDASVWVSLYAHDEGNHAASQAWFARAVQSREQFVAPSIVVVEVAAAIARRTGQPGDGLNVLAEIRSLPSLSLVTLTDDLVDEAADAAARLRLRAGDAVYVVVAARAGARLVTWDREQLTRGAALVQTATPAEDLAAQA